MTYSLLRGLLHGLVAFGLWMDACACYTYQLLYEGIDVYVIYHNSRNLFTLTK